MTQEIQTEDFELDEIDRMMYNRYEASNGQNLIAKIAEVEFKEGQHGGKYAVFELETKINEKKDKIEIPEAVPSDSDDIVKLCKANGVDPRFPSMLKGCEVEYDVDEGSIVIPKYTSRKDRVKNLITGVDIEDYFDGYVWKIYFHLFLPITIPVYWKVLDRHERSYWIEDPIDMIMLLFLWVMFAALIVALAHEVI